MPWYHGASLLEYLEEVPLADDDTRKPLRLPVQYVLRPDADFRGYAGQVVSGTIRPGDPVMVLPSGRTSRVKSLPSWGGDEAAAFAPMAATVCLEDELDVSRGDMLVHPERLPHVSRRLTAMLVWMSEQPLNPARPYLIKHTTQQFTATVSAVRYKVNVNTLAEEASDRLELNELGCVSLETTRPLFFDAYKNNRSTGSFILIDPISNTTVAAGMIEEPPRESSADRAAREALLELDLQATRLTPAERFARNGHHPATVWLAARRELAYMLERNLFQRGCHVHVVAEDVESHILPELVVLLRAAGLITIVSAASPEAAEFERARLLVGPERFLAFDPQSLPSSDQQAAEHICAELEERGVLPRTTFREGEGV